MAPWWEGVPKVGQGLRSSSGLDPEDPRGGMGLCLWDWCWGEGPGREGCAWGPSTQRALLLLPDPIIPSPSELRALLMLTPALGRWGPRCHSWPSSGGAGGSAPPQPGCTFGILLFSPSCLSVMGWAGAALRGHPGSGTSPATVPGLGAPAWWV